MICQRVWSFVHLWKKVCLSTSSRPFFGCAALSNITGRNHQTGRKFIPRIPHVLTPKSPHDDFWAREKKGERRKREGKGERQRKRKILLDSANHLCTFRIRLLALHQVDEHICDVVQLAHALRVELSGGVVGQPNGVERRIAERLRGHYFVELTIQVLADRPHAIRQADLLLAWHGAPHEHER